MALRQVSAFALLALVTSARAATVAMPTFSPAGGTYVGPRSVTISDTTIGAKIYYTTDGSTPRTSSALYTGPISVNTTKTIKAIAAAAGYTNSAVATATYRLLAATPTFSPPAGAYGAPQAVTISSATTGAKIYYTTNGATPTTASTLYGTPIAVSAATTVKAVAAATGFSNSAVASATYSFVAATPTFSPSAGTYISSQSVALAASSPGAKIYYTTDGTTPTTSSPLYSAPIAVSATTTVKALAAATGYSNSAVGSATYTITPPSAPPVFSPAAGTYASPQVVTISDATPGAQIYYTMDGTLPTAGSTLYSGPVSVGTTTTLTAIATASGYSSSAVSSATYTITAPCATPAFSPVGGTYPGTQSITISNATPGAQIFFTTDGSTPTTSSAQYTAPVVVASSLTVRAIGTAPGYSTSDVGAAAYTITPPAAAPAISPAGGAFGSSQVVTITDSTPGAQIFYTLDGSAPSSASSTYVGPFTVASSMTVKAIATAAGYATSPVASVAFTITQPAATPMLNPPPGSYGGPLTVLISDATPGAQIHYTTDGSIPTPGSTLYVGPLTFSTTTTVKVLAIATGYSSSVITSGTYAITTPAPQPTFSPPPGAYPGPQAVRIASSDPAAQIFYTVDGSDPTPTSVPYMAPIPVSATQTIRAVALAPGYSESAEAAGAYVIAAGAPDGIASEFTVTVTSTVPFLRISYSTTSPDILMMAFVSASGPEGNPQSVFVMDEPTGPAPPTPMMPYMTLSDQPGFTGVFLGRAPAPVSNGSMLVSPGIPGYPYTVTLVGLSGASDAHPMDFASAATGVPSVTVPSWAGSWVYAVGSDGGSSSSRMTCPNQILLAEVLDPPNHSTSWVQMLSSQAPPGAGTVTMCDVAPAQERWNFIAIEIVPAILPPPAFSPAPGRYDRQQAVTLASSVNAEIRFTTDGSTPTAGSPVYRQAIVVPETTTIRAIASSSGFTTSSVGSGEYAIVRILDTVAVDCPALVLQEGAAEQCTATGTYTDGTSRDLTSEVAWLSSEPLIAVVNAAGALTAVRSGVAMVSASQGTVSDHVLVTVIGTPRSQTTASVYYCYDGAGNMSARLSCPVGQVCEDQCP